MLISDILDMSFNGREIPQVDFGKIKAMNVGTLLPEQLGNRRADSSLVPCHDRDGSREARERTRYTVRRSQGFCSSMRLRRLRGRMSVQTSLM